MNYCHCNEWTLCAICSALLLPRASMLWRRVTKLHLHWCAHKRENCETLVRGVDTSASLNTSFCVLCACTFFTLWWFAGAFRLCAAPSERQIKNPLEHSSNCEPFRKVETSPESARAKSARILCRTLCARVFCCCCCMTKETNYLVSDAQHHHFAMAQAALPSVSLAFILDA